MRLFAALAVLLMAVPAAGGEVRLKDGEIVYGFIQGEQGMPKGSHLRLLMRRGKKRKIKVSNVAEVLPEGEPFKRVRKSGFAGAWGVARNGVNQADQRWGAPRRKALSAGGGTAGTEKAVRRALTWLAAHQDDDGKLDADRFMKHDPEGAKTDGPGGGHHGERRPCGYDGVTTAVALMAWSAAGNTAVSGPYRENVRKALAWCVALLERGPGNAYGLWNHGFCTQAVVDAYLLRPDPALVPVIEGAVQAILRLQRDDGGWSYYMPIGDLPTTGVAAAALALAARAGFAVPRAAVSAALTYLDARVDVGSGRSEYHDGAERKGYTPTRANAATGLTVRALLGTLAKTAHLGKQVGAIREKPVWKIHFKEVKTKSGKKVRAQIGNLYPYQWYYTTMALFERGGATWTGWFGGLKSALLKGQRRDGSFKGSWDPLGNYSTSAGRVFITGLCTLMLQTPYRYARAP